MTPFNLCGLFITVRLLCKRSVHGTQNNKDMKTKQLSKVNTTAPLLSAKTRADLANLLGYTHKNLTYIAYKLKENEKYSLIEIPKKHSKEKRKVYAPTEKLKSIQKKLSVIIQDALEEQNRKQNLSHGFTKNKNTTTNAKKHKNKRFVFNIDLKDFFESISFYRIRGALMKNKHLQLSYEVANTIAHIACRDKRLPQGSPLSPVLSNLIGLILDNRLSKLAKLNGCAYSRYADDITFSTNKKIFPCSIARISEGQTNKWTPGDKLLKTIKESGFEINTTKTRMTTKTERQEVTGIVVNRKINTPIEYRKTVRAYVHSLIKNGEFFIKQNEISESTTKGTESQLLGMLNHITYADKSNNKEDRKEQSGNPTGIHLVFRNFVFYTRLFNPRKPTIICEGYTDVAYLKCAIK